MEISKESFGITKSGQLITSYTIKNSNNIEVKIINYDGNERYASIFKLR